MNFLGHLMGLDQALEERNALASQSPRWRQAIADQVAAMADAAATISSLSRTPLDPSLRQEADLLARLAKDPSPLLSPKVAQAFGLIMARPRRLGFTTFIDTLCQAQGQLVEHRLLLNQSRCWRQAVAWRGSCLTALSDQLTALSGVPNFQVRYSQIELEHLATL